MNYFNIEDEISNLREKIKHISWVMNTDWHIEGFILNPNDYCSKK